MDSRGGPWKKNEKKRNEKVVKVDHSPNVRKRKKHGFHCSKRTCENEKSVDASVIEFVAEGLRGRKSIGKRNIF